MTNQQKLAAEELKEYWGEVGVNVALTTTEERTEMTMDEFLNHCTACGGNWGGMFLTGIKELFPKTYEVIPEDMGDMAFCCLCCVLILLGVDTES